MCLMFQLFAVGKTGVVCRHQMMARYRLGRAQSGLVGTYRLDSLSVLGFGGCGD
jgi:hypothetical protein